MGPVSQPPQSPPCSCGGGGRVVGDFPMEGGGAARAVRLERRREGALGGGALRRALVLGTPGGCVQCGPGRVGAAEAAEECCQVPGGALQGQQQEVPRARQEGHRPPQHEQHRKPRLRQAVVTSISLPINSSPSTSSHLPTATELLHRLYSSKSYQRSRSNHELCAGVDFAMSISQSSILLHKFAASHPFAVWKSFNSSVLPA